MAFICSSKGLFADFLNSPSADHCVSKRDLQATLCVSALLSDYSVTDRNQKALLLAVFANLIVRVHDMLRKFH